MAQRNDSFRIIASCEDGHQRAFYMRAKTGAEAAADLLRLTAELAGNEDRPVTIVSVQRECRP